MFLISCQRAGLKINEARPHNKLPYRGAWLWVGSEMIHLMELPNPDPLTGRPEHGGRDRHTCIAIRDVSKLKAILDEAGNPSPHFCLFLCLTTKSLQICLQFFNFYGLIMLLVEVDLWFLQCLLIEKFQVFHIPLVVLDGQQFLLVILMPMHWNLHKLRVNSLPTSTYILVYKKV